MRRILQSQGAEVIHLGHNRSVQEVVDAALEEDVQGVAVSSYQGGHVEYFEYLVESLRAAGAGHVKVYGGGGGVIVADGDRAAARLRRHDLLPRGRPAARPRRDDQLDRSRDCDVDLWARPPVTVDAGRSRGDRLAVARAITGAEAGRARRVAARGRTPRGREPRRPVLGITGTGGSGKSSLTDELVRRFRIDQQDKLRIAVLAVDPTRRRAAARCSATGSG